MRITNNMIMDVVVRNLSLSLNRYMHLQNMMSTGRRLNKPSDDPIGVTQDLGYRSRLSNMDQFQKNINFGQAWLATSENALAEIANLVAQAKELAAQMANDIYDETARQGAITQIESIIEQIVDLANVQHQGRYVFAGHKTLNPAFIFGGEGIVYNGDSGAIQIEIESGTKMAINLLGSDFLTFALGALGDGSDLNPGIDENTVLGDLFLGELGKKWSDFTSFDFDIIDENLGVNINVDLSSLDETSTISDLIDLVNNALIAAGDTHLRVAISESNNSLTFIASDKISTDTLLSDLGVNPGIITIEYDDPDNPGNRLTKDITVTPATMTVGDLISAMESAGVPGLEVSLNSLENGLLLEDTNAIPLSMKVLNTQSALDLGIVGDFDQSNQLVGDAFNPFLIGANTSLSDLNSGVGVDMAEGKFIVEYGENQLVVDLTGAETIGDVISKINVQCSSLNLTARIDPSSRRLLLTDNNHTPLNFKIREYGDQFTTASDLGILGDFDGDTLLGGKLNPQPKYSFDFDTEGSLIENFGLDGTMNRVKDTGDLNPLLKDITNISLLKNGLGLELGKIKIVLGDQTYTVDLSDVATLQDILDAINNCGAGVVASINDDLTGISITPPAGNTQSLLICNADDTGTASALGIAGSPDIIGTLMALKDALDRSDANDISNTIEVLGQGHNKLLSTRASVGAKGQTLDTTHSRLEDFKLNMTKLLSEVEDADIIKVATDLAAQEAVYRAALQAVARVIQPSLLDFLR